jgi:uncharacterized protein
MRIPTDAEIRALHEKHAPTPQAFDRVYSHCEIVCGIAEQLLARVDVEHGASQHGASQHGASQHGASQHGALDLDVDLVRAGCLLHDIGVYRLFDGAGELDLAGYIRHGILGHELLAGEGFPAAICRFCSCHTGMGLTRDDVRDQNLPLPVADYLAESAEERLVMYADKFHSKTDPPVFVRAPTYAAGLGRFGTAKVTDFDALRAEYGEPDLTSFIKRYGHAVV